MPFGFDRIQRHLHQATGVRVKSVSAPPTQSEGANGDMRMHNGTLYIKDENLWNRFASTSSQTVDKTVGGAVSTAFSAYNSVTDQDLDGNGVWTTIDFDTELFDVGDNFSADIYTAPIAGKYFFTTTITIMQQAADYWVQAEIVTSSSSHRAVLQPDAGLTDYNSISVTCVVDLSVGDTAYVRVLAEPDTDQDFDILQGAHLTYFMGYNIESDLVSKVNQIIELLQLDIKSV